MYSRDIVVAWGVAYFVILDTNSRTCGDVFEFLGGRLVQGLAALSILFQFLWSVCVCILVLFLVACWGGFSCLSVVWLYTLPLKALMATYLVLLSNIRQSPTLSCPQG